MRVHAVFLAHKRREPMILLMEEGPMSTLSETAAPAPATAIKHNRENPFQAPVIERRLLTHVSSSKATVHLALSIADSAIAYEPGDSCGVLPENDPLLVDTVLSAAGFSGDEPVHLAKQPAMTLREALLHHVGITKLSRKIVDRYAQAGEIEKLFHLLKAEQQEQLDAYVYERGLIDLLEEFPGVVKDADALVAMLPKMSPRLYSISSSPLAHAGELHTTVAVVRYRTLGRDRGGVCSTQLGERAAEGDHLPIYIQPNKKFRLPHMDTPLIMIGPGTGIAPFRAFLHERRVLGATGRNWLFFGERSAATDFLYRDELESMHADGHLTRLDTAFSRDQDHKIYVQDRMKEQAANFWSWLQDGAFIYVCGDANHMAKDVDAALHSIVETQGSMNAEAAKEFVQHLKDHHRYHRDVY
jgi:sulfite reductase (NADPH) flavoprotein alpha-component